MLSYNISADSAIGSFYNLYGFTFPDVSQSKSCVDILMLQWAALLSSLTGMYCLQLSGI